jgi:hypothetical protein
LISEDQQQVLVKDNFLDLNFGETSTSYTQTGLTFSFKASGAGTNLSINTTTNTLTFSARSGATRAKIVASTASGIPAATFASGDIIQIAGTTNAENDGIYVVHANSEAGTIEFRSVAGAGDTVNAAFALQDCTAETESTANPVTISKVDLLALRSSNAGALQTATGAVDGSFASYTSIGADQTLQEAYAAGATITTASSTDLALTLTSGNFTATGAGAVSLTPTSASTFTSGAALTLTGGAASTWSTSSGALTITSSAACTWST